MEENKNLNSNFSKKEFYIILFLIIVGIALCVELGVIFWKTNFFDTFKPSFCSTSDLIDCDGVALTSYSLSFGVPNFLWGLILYLTMGMLLFVDKIQSKFKNTIFDVFERPRSYIAFLSLLSFALSMVLAYISIVEIRKICVLCFCTYVVDFLIMIVSLSIMEHIKNTILDFIKGAKKYLALFLTVLCIFSATIYYLNDSFILSPKLKKQKLEAEFYQSKTNKYAVKGNILGKEDAKVKINLYSDFNCPYCRVANIMLHKIAKDKDVLIKDVHYPLDTTCNRGIGTTLMGHELSCLQSRYALAAKKQDKYWGVANLFFDKNMSQDERPTNEDDVINLIKASHLGINIEQLVKDAKSPEIEVELQQNIKSAYDINIAGTPSMEINGVVYMGIMPYDDLVEKIDLAQKRADN